jgi:Asp-tRNA(Asn)/Glu-tRNA(Gln) amidotransferase C subunit
MREFQESDVKALTVVAGVNVSEEDLPVLTIRLNGIIEMFQILESLPIDDMEPIPTLLTQKEG